MFTWEDADVQVRPRLRQQLLCIPVGVDIDFQAVNHCNVRAPSPLITCQIWVCGLRFAVVLNASLALQAPESGL